MIIKSIKKIFPLAAGVGFLSIAVNALATPTPTAIQVNLGNVGSGVGLAADTSLGVILGNAVKIILAIALIAALFMLVYGAFQWIISGGEKEAVANARNRITHALIGLLLLGLTFVIITIVGNIVGVNILGNLTIPTLSTK